MTEILDGKKIATAIYGQLKLDASKLAGRGIVPTLALVTVTKDEAVLWYVRAIVRAADAIGVKTRNVALDPAATFEQISTALKDLADDRKIHGIILQTPMPKGIDVDRLRALIPPAKDVDGANPLSVGRLVSGLPTFAPATAAAVMKMLEQYKIPLKGARAVVVGRSRIVGKPLIYLLLDANATVTICHSKTVDLASATNRADVLIVAIGQPALIDARYIKKGAVVIDVGTNIDPNGKVIGDVDAKSAGQKASAVSPVPGGVGPVTTAILLEHVMRTAYE